MFILRQIAGLVMFLILRYVMNVVCFGCVGIMAFYDDLNRCLWGLVKLSTIGYEPQHTIRSFVVVFSSPPYHTPYLHMYLPNLLFL